MKLSRLQWYMLASFSIAKLLGIITALLIIQHISTLQSIFLAGSFLFIGIVLILGFIEARKLYD